MKKRSFGVNSKPIGSEDQEFKQWLVKKILLSRQCDEVRQSWSWKEKNQAQESECKKGKEINWVSKDDCVVVWLHTMRDTDAMTEALPHIRGSRPTV